MTITLVMILHLMGGQLAEQPASVMECQLVTEALARNELVEIDADDSRRYRVLEAECQLSNRYEAACEGEGA
jgi:hypothetical protein